MYPTNSFYLPADGREPEPPQPQQGTPKSINTKDLPPEVVIALKRLGYPVEETPMSNSDRVEYAVPASDPFASPTIIEPSQQLADNFSQLLAFQAQITPQPYIPYIDGV